MNIGWKINIQAENKQSTAPITTKTISHKTLKQYHVLVMPKSKDTNTAVNANSTWPVLTEYTSPQGNAGPQAGPYF